MSTAAYVLDNNTEDPPFREATTRCIISLCALRQQTRANLS